MDGEVNEKVNGVCKMVSSSLWMVLEEDEDDDGDLKKSKVETKMNHPSLEKAYVVCSFQTLYVGRCRDLSWTS